MNILIISRGIPNPNDAQWGSFEFDQAKALAKYGHKVIVACVDTRLRMSRRKIGVSRNCVDGITTYIYYCMPSIFIEFFSEKIGCRFIAWQWQKLGKAIQQQEDKIDVIYSHYLFNSYYAVKCLQSFQAPIVAIEHWSEINEQPVPKMVKFYAAATYPQTRKVITVSKSLQARLKELFNVEAEVVYNMVGTEFSYVPKAKTDKMRFVATGSLIRRKGFDLLPEAFKLANLPCDKWELDIIGEGEEHQNLQRQIDAYGFGSNIHLTGAKDKREIASILNQCDAFVLPSRNENFSVAVLEALACGVPVISSICGGIRECINDENGILFEVDDVRGLAKAIKSIYTDPQCFNRQTIAAECKSRFSSEVIAKQLTGIFEGVVIDETL